MRKVLSKSKFKVGLECPNKLYYYGDKKYANKQTEDTFLQTLAEGGFQVEALARLHYPNGHFIQAKPWEYKAAFIETKKALQQDKIIIYEAAFLVDEMYVMVDILVKNGNKIKLIEVKAKSYDPNNLNEFIGTRGAINSGWRPYLFDLAYQHHVAQQCFSDFEFEAYFLMADKSKTAKIDGLNQMIRLPKSGDIRKDVQVRITPEEALKTTVLSEVNVTHITKDIISGTFSYNDTMSFLKAIPLLKSVYVDKVYPNWPTKFTACKSCEYKTDEVDKLNGLKSGFEHCFKTQHNWTENDFNRPTVFELWNFRGQKLLEQNRLFLDDVTIEDLKVQDEPYKMSSKERRWVQVEKALSPNKEPHVEKEGLKSEMDSWTYPLHFIDFETSAMALPFTKDRRPYEQVAFQFSHHICYKDGTIEHKSEYINNISGDFPNFKFVAALKASLEHDKGSIFCFATHENSILNAIKVQLDSSDFPNKDALISFIKTISKPTAASVDQWIPSRPMVDLRIVILKYYYNPLTKGSNSIKALLPAILNTCAFLKKKYTQPINTINLTSLNFDPKHVWLKFKDDVAISPYKSLPLVFEKLTSEELNNLISGMENISNGGAALTAYSKLQFVDMSQLERDTITKGLLKYCELDTLAMVMIYEHLKSIIN